METNLTAIPAKLAPGDILRIHDASGQRITVVRGMVWVTQEGDPRDVFLSDGEDFAFERTGTALVEAITETQLLPLVDGTTELIRSPSRSQDTARSTPRGHQRSVKVTGART